MQQLSAPTPPSKALIRSSNTEVVGLVIQYKYSAFLKANKSAASSVSSNTKMLFGSGTARDLVSPTVCPACNCKFQN